ncbi:MAG: hypothetical protein LLG45_02100 [Actinomycetia bacterium]|nr:hypothetical protein [Actinomycetes bacterium]
MRTYDPYTQMLQHALGTLRLEKTRVHKGLCVLPLTSTAECSAKYVLLETAVARGTLTVTEVDEAGSVPYLAAVNKGPWPVLIFDGEELQGAKQNRICNATILVGVGKSVLPVSCVEQGRWSSKSQAFSVGMYAAHPSLRMKKEFSVRRHAAMSAVASRTGGHEHAQGRTGGPAAPASGFESQQERAARYGGAQAEVWDEVAESIHRLGVRSGTMALADNYESRGGDVDEYVKALCPDDDEALAGMVGVAVFVNGRLACLDLLQPPKRFRQLYPKLLRGYALEALFSVSPWASADMSSEQERPTHPDLRSAARPSDFDPEAITLRLYDELKEARLQTQTAVDLGQDLRLEGRTVLGAGLAWNQDIIQLSLFPKKAA